MATTQSQFESMAEPIGLPNSGQNYVPVSATTKPGQGDIFTIAARHGSDRRLVAAGVGLFSEGETADRVYIVLEGWFLLHRILEDGRRQILDFALPGTLLGYRATSAAPFAFSAETLTRAEIATVPLSRMRELLHRGSDCAAVLLDAANEALLYAFDTLTDVGRRSAREAVASFLLRMDRRIRARETENDDGSIPFLLTQEHIGDALGLTAVHVCRTLRVLRDEGLVEAGKGRLRIVDKEALAVKAGVRSADFYRPDRMARRRFGFNDG